MANSIAIISDSGIQYDGRVQRIVKSFVKKDFYVDLFIPNYKYDFSFLFDNERVNIISYDTNPTKLNVNLFFWKKYENCIQKVLDQNKRYSYIYVNDYPLLSAGVELKKRIKTKLIYDTHEIYIETINQFFPTTKNKRFYGTILIEVNKFIHFQREKRLIKEVDSVLTVCNSFKDYFYEKYGVVCDVIKNCPLEVPSFERSNIIREKLNLKKEDKILLYQGMFTEGRGLQKLVKSARYFHHSIHLVLLGGGPIIGKLKEYAKESSNIHFIPLIPNNEVINYISSADMGILLIEKLNKSKELTLPNKVFDYMAGGIPFITNNLPEASSIAMKHNCGYVIDDETPELVASSINKILFEDNYTKAENSKKALVENYIWGKDFEVFYHCLIKKKSDQHGN
jgi:glycosyltransferase involved in cell wall biosynthesis